MAYLEKAKADCLAQIDLPEGYRIELDSETDHLMVYGPSLCFCITAKAIVDGMHLRTFVPALEGLVRAENARPL